MLKKIVTLAACTSLVLGFAGSAAFAKRGRSGTGVEDNLPRNSGVDNVVGGVTVRGNGTVDDTTTSGGTTTTTTAVKLRGNGTVDDGNNNRRRGR